MVYIDLSKGLKASDSLEYIEGLNVVDKRTVVIQ